MWLAVAALGLTLVCAHLSLAETPTAADPDLSSDKLPSNAELEARAARIGNVSIRIVNIFDESDPRENKWLYRLANDLHIKTRESTVAAQLLFNSGDIYSARKLEETERILRGRKYLSDAWVRPVPVHDKTVDVDVVVQDVWTLSPSISFGRKGGVNTTSIELQDENFLGRGKNLSIGRTDGVDRTSTLLQYDDHSLWGSRWQLNLDYADSSDGSMRGMNLERPFYALDTRWTAGLTAVTDEKIESHYSLGEIADQFGADRTWVDVRAGWSPGLQQGWAHRWTVGWRLDEATFRPAPDLPVPSALPPDRRLVYPWAAFELIQDDFAKTRNQDQIGLTEDLAFGKTFRAELGWANPSFGADRDAAPFAVSAGAGFTYSPRASLFIHGVLDGRVESASLRNTTLGADARYYWRWSQRQVSFARLSAIAGRELDPDRQLLLGGDNGLRGYPLRYQAGDSLALLTLEQRIFTAWYPFRLFRVGGAVFFDAGRTWGPDPVNVPNLGLLKDVGLGLRIGSVRSGLGNILHIDIAFPLDGDPSIDKVQLLVETKASF